MTDFDDVQAKLREVIDEAERLGVQVIAKLDQLRASAEAAIAETEDLKQQSAAKSKTPQPQQVDDDPFPVDPAVLEAGKLLASLLRGPEDERSRRLFTGGRTSIPRGIELLATAISSSGAGHQHAQTVSP